MSPLQATKRKSQGISFSSKRRKGLSRSTEPQPVDVEASQLSSQRLSPPTASTTAPLTFESRLRESQPQDAIVAPEGSKAATVAIAEDDNALEEDFDAAFADDFNRIN
ncbi:hypothetical protein L13192_00292 [Pyrenophora tritici-repentis]|nr:hypothetical protein L13192_00292 [Pyrenophora tritici-repentis]